MSDKASDIFADGAQLLAQKIIEKGAQDKVSISLASKSAENQFISQEGYKLLAEVVNFLAKADSEFK